MTEMILYAVGTFALALVLTPIVRYFAFAVGAVDVPRPPRNLHERTTAKLGGLAVFLAFVISLVVFMLRDGINFTIIPQQFIYAIVAGGLVLMLGGFLDDKYDLSPSTLWLFPAGAAFLVVYSGIGVGIQTLSNPFGDPISLHHILLGVPLSGIMIWLWLMGMMFTTKFLDGLDGLVTGVGFIASLTLFFLSLSERVNQPITATLALMLCGALLGFLIYNFHPASIFLGDGGSLFVGFVLGVLSVILGGKIATAFLVMGIPILDVAWVIARRIWTGKSPFRGDRLHLHFRLLDAGFTQRRTVVTLYVLAAIFGFTALFLQSFGKLIALIVLSAAMIGLVVGSVVLYNRNSKIKNTTAEDA